VKTIIQTGAYPTRIALVPETPDDWEAMKELKYLFTEDKDSSVECAYEESDDVQEFGPGVLTITAWCDIDATVCSRCNQPLPQADE